MAGIHINELKTQHLSFIGRVRPAVNLLLNPKREHALEIKSRSQESKLIGRPYIKDGDFHQSYLSAGTAEGARQAGKNAAQLCLDHRIPEIDAWIILNEPPVATIEQVRLLAEFDAEFARAMSRGSSKACIGAFSRGTPEIAEKGGAAILNAYTPALRTAYDVGAWLAIHQYGKYPLLQDAEYLALRWQAYTLPYYRRQGVPIPRYVITEFGLDLGIGVDPQDKDGWRATPYLDNPIEYVNQLLKLAQEYAKDPMCIGATIFCAGYIGWQSFAVDGDLLDYLATLNWPKFGVSVPAPIPVPVPVPTPGGSAVTVEYKTHQSKHSRSREGRGVQYLILHTTESPVKPKVSTQQNTLDYLVENDRAVSTHDYLAQFPDGSIRLYGMVPYSRAAHHAGADTARLPSGYAGTEVNLRTIGIEVYRRVDKPVPAIVWEALIDWAVARCKEYNLQVSQILSHAQVDPTRRSDPVGLNMVWFRDRVAQELGAVVQVPGPKPERLPLPEDESLDDLTTFLQKATYWSEQEIREYVQRQFARASAIRISLAKYLALGRDKWGT